MTCAGEPIRVSVCHCLACQQRTGGVFSAQARWPDDNVTIEGEWKEWERLGDEGGRATFRFCPACGSTVAYVIDASPGMTAVPIGAFADPAFPAPTVSVYEERRHPWVAICGEDIEHTF